MLPKKLGLLLTGIFISVSGLTACVFNQDNFGDSDATDPYQILGEFVDELPEELQDYLPGNHPPGETAPPEYGGIETSLKVPVPSGYNWEITQSWSDHCQTCNDKGYDTIYGDYCAGADSTHLYSCCDKGWDFNLPGTTDLGKSVLAVGDGTVAYVGWDGSWGETVIQDLGENVCARYSHLVQHSTNHLSVGDDVCQGLHLGEIGGTPDWPVHLHFQFETCDTEIPLAIEFTDGNGAPECTIGADVFDSSGNYNFLNLTNEVRYSCDSTPDYTPPNEDGWIAVGGCGPLPNCPLNPECDRDFGHEFTDQYLLDAETADAADYLWRECALNGKADGGLHPHDVPTRAETLKLALYLFGLIYECDGSETENFADVSSGDWFRDVVACGIDHNIISSEASHFRPNDEIQFPELVKILVEAGVANGAISLAYNSADQHFPNISNESWAFIYVETAYNYGAISRHPGEYHMDSRIPRSEMLQIAVGLSPCFCDNVICSGGCQCNQELLRCEDPSSSGQESGGGLDIYEDISIECEATSWSYCQTDSAYLDVKCTLENASEEALQYNNLEIEVEGPNCEVVEGQLRSGSGTYSIDGGSTEELGGYFLVTCDQPPEDDLVQARFNLSAEMEGEVQWINDVDATTIYVDPSVLDCWAMLESSPTYIVEDDLTIDCEMEPDTRLIVFTDGGSITGQSTVADSYFTADFGHTGLFLDYNCEDLPVWLFVEGGSSYMNVAQHYSMHDISVWIGASSFQTEAPYLPADEVGWSYHDHEGEVEDVLIRIPAIST